jgi:hypothetical protein
MTGHKEQQLKSTSVETSQQLEALFNFASISIVVIITTPPKDAPITMVFFLCIDYFLNERRT